MDSSDERARLQWFLSAIVENIPTMVFVKDAENLKFELFNKAGEDLLGVARADLHGKSDHDFFPKEQADFFTANDRAVLAKGEVVAVEEPIETKDGARWLYTKKIPIRDEAGVPRYLLGVSLDITERRTMESRLRTTLDQVVEMEPMVVLGQIAKESIAELHDCLARGDEASLRRARELAERIRQAVP